MPEFCSFLVFRPTEIDLIHKICAEAGWRVRDIEDSTTIYQFTENSRSQLAQVSALKDFKVLMEGQQYGRLLVIDCDEEEADNICNLIWAANLIIEAFPPEQSPPSSAFPLPADLLRRWGSSGSAVLHGVLFLRPFPAVRASCIRAALEAVARAPP